MSLFDKSGQLQEPSKHQDKLRYGEKGESPEVKIKHINFNIGT